MQESCSNEADPISCLCARAVGGEITNRSGQKILKFWMLGCITSVTFQSFRSASTCSLAKPGLSFLLSSLNFVFFFFFLIRSRAYCNLQNDLNDRSWKSFTCEMSSKSIISKIAKWKSVIYKTRIHEVNSTGQKDKSVSSSLE